MFKAWLHKYPSRARTGSEVITTAKPGKAIAEAIDEIQDTVICEIVSADDRLTVKKKGNVAVIDIEDPDGGSSIPDGTQQYQVLAWNGSAWVADWVRAHS